MILTPEQKAEDVKGRIEKFNEGLKKLSEETMLGVKAQIMPDGPIINLVDMKKYD